MRLAAWIIVSLMLALAGAEALTRIFLPAPVTPFEKQFEPKVTREPAPYMMFKGRPGADIGDGERLNPLGYRGPMPALPKPPGELRVLVLGGSTVFNGFPPLPALIEAELHARGLPQARVYNLGVVSANSGMDLARLVFEGADMQPDFTLFYNGANDLIHPHYGDPRPGYPFNFVTYEKNPLYSRNVDNFTALFFAGYVSSLVRHVYQSFHAYFSEKVLRMNELRAENGWLGPEWMERIANIYVGNCRKARDVCAGLGSGFAAVFQPMLYYKTPLSPEEAEALVVYAYPQAEELRARIFEAARRQRLPLVDASGFYAGWPMGVFTDMVHTTQQAKPDMARFLADQIMAGLQRPPGTPPGTRPGPPPGSPPGASAGANPAGPPSELSPWPSPGPPPGLPPGPPPDPAGGRP